MVVVFSVGIYIFLPICFGIDHSVLHETGWQVPDMVDMDIYEGGFSVLYQNQF
jgi:hypothetical protein